MKGRWEEVESVRMVRQFKYEDHQIMIIPSMQDDLYHFILANQFGIVLNILLTEEAIYNTYGIEL